jgi:hypothetical protein
VFTPTHGQSENVNLDVLSAGQPSKARKEMIK